MIKEKKGVSAVVATVLIILLTLVVIGIVANYVIPFVKKSLEGTECFKFRDYFKFDESFNLNCYKDAAGSKEYIVSVRANGEVEDANKVIGFELKFLGEGTGVPVSVRDSSAIGSIPNFKAYNDVKDDDNTFAIPSLKSAKDAERSYSVLSYVYTVNNNFDKVEAYPVIEGGEICKRSDLINLKRCE